MNFTFSLMFYLTIILDCFKEKKFKKLIQTWKFIKLCCKQKLKGFKSIQKHSLETKLSDLTQSLKQSLRNSTQ